jgi:hypothetical protein
MSYVAINIPDWLPQLPQSRNSSRSFKTALPHTNTTNSQSSFVTAKSYNDNNNAHVVNTNDPHWLEKEGVNTSYNINVEARKRWLARQPQIRNRSSRRQTCELRHSRNCAMSEASASLAIASHSQYPVRQGERDVVEYVATRKSGRRSRCRSRRNRRSRKSRRTCYRRY